MKVRMSSDEIINMFNGGVLENLQQIERIDAIKNTVKDPSDKSPRPEDNIEFFMDEDIVGYPWWEEWKKEKETLEKEVAKFAKKWQKTKSDEDYAKYSEASEKLSELIKRIDKDVDVYKAEYKKDLARRAKESLTDVKDLVVYNIQRLDIEIGQVHSKQNKVAEKMISLKSRIEQAKTEEERAALQKELENYQKLGRNLREQINHLFDEKNKLLKLQLEYDLDKIQSGLEEIEPEITPQGPTAPTGPQDPQGQTGPTAPNPLQLGEHNELDMSIEFPDLPPISPDEEAAKAEYEERKRDMLKKYYGDKEAEAEYQERYERFKSNIVEEEFEYIDENGETKTGVFKKVQDYEGKEDDEKFLQLEEYSQRLERQTKFQAGDKSVYRKTAEKIALVNHIYNQLETDDEKQAFIEALALEMQETDNHYIETNNDAYNKHSSTQTNLMTMGKFGEKAPYLDTKNSSLLMKPLKAFGNAIIWLRNHTTAPIYRFVGKKIVAPIHKRIFKDKVKGAYTNDLTHRYQARKDYFEQKYIQELQEENMQREADGKKPKKPNPLKMLFGTRLESLFKAKEGNIAVTSAGAIDVQEYIRRKYGERAIKDYMIAQYEGAEALMIEKINKVVAKLETARENPEAFDEKAIEELKAAIDVGKQNLMTIRQKLAATKSIETANTIQTDAVSLAQHDAANKANVNRTITGIKMFAKAAVTFTGPKIKEWLLQKYTTTTKTWVPPQTTTSQQMVPGHYQNVTVNDPTQLTGSEIVGANVGKQVTGFETVYGGEVGRQMFEIPKNGKITALWEKAPGSTIGSGISDGVTIAPHVHTDILSKLVDANGVLRQDLSLADLAKEMGGLQNLSNVYVSVNDVCWIKLGDLVSKGMQVPQWIPGGMQTITNTIPGYWNTVTTVNQKLASILDKLQTGVISTMVADSVLDVYENARRTKTAPEMEREGLRGKVSQHQRDNKADLPRYYDNVHGFTGTKDDIEGDNTYNENEREEDEGR